MSSGIQFNQRDIILIPFPYSDLTGSKIRPALIISNNKLNKSEDRLCCLITSQQPQDLHIRINSIEEGDLPKQSWIKPHRLFSISKHIIKKKIGTLPKKQYNNVSAIIMSCIE